MTSTTWNPAAARLARRTGMAGLAAWLLALAACGDGGSNGAGGQPPSQQTSKPAVTAVGEPNGAVATARVGPAGGSLRSADGSVELVVPAGALASEVELTATPITVTAPGGLRAYRLGPEGTTFAVPATVRFKLTESELEGSSAEVAAIGYQDAKRQWRVLRDSTYANGEISVQTRHLSDWSALLGWQLRPPSARVQVGRSVELSVRYCERVNVSPPDKDELVSLSGLCVEDDLGKLIQNWSVNGAAGGSAVTGTVDWGNPTATYNAPARVPTPALVAVSVEVFPHPESTTLTRLVSNITVVETGPAYVGRIHFSNDHVIDAVGDVTWSPARSNGDPDAAVLEYTPSGTVSGRLNPDPAGRLYDCPSVPVTLPIAGDSPSLRIFKGMAPPVYQFSIVAFRPDPPLLNVDCVFKETGETVTLAIAEQISILVSPNTRDCPMLPLKELATLAESAYVCRVSSLDPEIKASWDFKLQE